VSQGTGVAPDRREVGALGLPGDELVACVACGLCLPHCPTFRVTGLEIASPRGRIAAMRAVEHRELPADAAFIRAMDECVQCRACEAACPSSVPFGHLMEITRAAVQRGTTRRIGRTRRRRFAEWVGFRLVLPRHWALMATTWVLAVAQRLWLVPDRFGVPTISPRSLRRLNVPIGAYAGTTDPPTVWMFTGCVMDAWMRDTHRSTVRVLRAMNRRVVRPGRDGACCGALHLHAGRHDDAVDLAYRVIASMPGDLPIIVNSAGCGAMLKDYGRLLGTEKARAFSARVRDFSEFVAAEGVPLVKPTDQVVVVQDPCHLRNVQHVEASVRAALGHAFPLVDTDDDGLCCGAGGVYAAVQPELAAKIRERKIEALRAAAHDDDPVVCSANPGCLLHLQAAGVDARHPADLLAARLARTKGAESRRQRAIAPSESGSAPE
jgi:glycolate oxidase iron-sulfur subunit